MGRSFELTRNITIGQYYPGSSLIHSFDPRLKLLSFLVLIFTIAFNATYVGNGIGLLFSLLLFPAAGIPLRYGLSGLIPAIPFMVIIAVLQLLFQGPLFPGGKVYFHYGIILISDEIIRLIIVSMLRFIEIIFLTSILTLTTSTTHLSHALGRLLKPLATIKLPVHEISLIFTIALRFVPTLALEAEKIMKAQASRGAEYGTGAWWNIIKRTKEMFPLIIPLFLSALSRGEELIWAMEARGYLPGEKRTSYITYKVTTKDWLLFVTALLFAFLIVFTAFIH